MCARALSAKHLPGHHLPVWQAASLAYEPRRPRRVADPPPGGEPSCRTMPKSLPTRQQLLNDYVKLLHLLQEAKFTDLLEGLPSMDQLFGEGWPIELDDTAKASFLEQTPYNPALETRVRPAPTPDPHQYAPRLCAASRAISDRATRTFRRLLTPTFRTRSSPGIRAASSAIRRATAQRQAGAYSAETREAAATSVLAE